MREVYEPAGFVIEVASVENLNRRGRFDEATVGRLHEFVTNT